jgi:hypothetical protein
MPSMLGGGEVIAHALVAGTEIGTGEGIVAGAVVGIVAGLDVSVEAGVVEDVAGVVGTADVGAAEVVIAEAGAVVGAGVRAEADEAGNIEEGMVETGIVAGEGTDEAGMVEVGIAEVSVEGLGELEGSVEALVPLQAKTAKERDPRAAPPITMPVSLRNSRLVIFLELSLSGIVIFGYPSWCGREQFVRHFS